MVRPKAVRQHAQAHSLGAHAAPVPRVWLWVHLWVMAGFAPG